MEWFRRDLLVLKLKMIRKHLHRISCQIIHHFYDPTELQKIVNDVSYIVFINFRQLIDNTLLIVPELEIPPMYNKVTTIIKNLKENFCFSLFYNIMLGNKSFH